MKVIKREGGDGWWDGEKFVPDVEHAAEYPDEFNLPLTLDTDAQAYPYHLYPKSDGEYGYINFDREWVALVLEVV